MAGRKGPDVLDGGLRDRHRAHLKEAEQGLTVALLRNQSASKQRPYLRGEHQSLPVAIVVERLDAKPVSCQDDTRSGPGLEYREGVHSAETGKYPFAPHLVATQNGLGV